MDEVITQMDERMAAGLAKIVSEMEGTDYSLRILYSKMLFYIHKNKDYYGIVVKQKVAAPLILITEVAKPKILKVWKKESRVKLSDDDLEKILTILEWENCGVVWWWGEKYKFADKKIGSIAKRMTILTNKVYRELKWWQIICLQLHPQLARRQNRLYQNRRTFCRQIWHRRQRIDTFCCRLA